MDIPNSVLELMDRLEDRGHECCCVGGCVRDWLMGIEPHDYDCCTAATPERLSSPAMARPVAAARAQAASLPEGRSMP